MKSFYAFVAVVLMVLPTQAQSLNDDVFNVTNPDAELLFHTAAPGIKVLPRAEKMMICYDVTLLPREDEAYFRWIHVDENGEALGLWTKWREFDGTYTFTNPGRYVLETFAEANGKEPSSRLSVTFEVSYVGMSSAPGIMLLPCGERGYNVTLTSLYGDETYYRCRFYEVDTWDKWHLSTEAIPFTEAGKYVLEAHCNTDIMAACIEVPSVDYCKPGDVNHNEVVDLEDLTTLIGMLMDSKLVLATGDVNKDGVVAITDVTALINLLLTK